jgi:hypothetical protein
MFTHPIPFLLLSLFSRERNRMHAKMTRDRKKCFIATVQKAIDDLEQELVRLRRGLSEQERDDDAPMSSSTGNHHNLVTPELTARPSPPSSSSSNRSFSSAVSSSFRSSDQQQKKRVCHGFSLDS